MLFSVIGMQAQVIFSEDFASMTGNAGWSGSAAGSTVPNTKLTTWTLVDVFEGAGCIRVGTSSKQGTATTPALQISGDGSATLTFKAGAWDNSTEKTEMTVSISGGGTLSYGSATDVNSVSVTIPKASWSPDITVQITGGTTTTKISFIGYQASRARFFLDDVVVSMPTPATPNYWTGAAGTTDWATAGNWSNGVAPTSTEDLIFDVNATQDLVIAGNITVANLENQSSKKLIVAPAASLTVTGTVTGYSTEADAQKLLIQANGTQANGSFLVADATQVVHATVEMWSKAKKYSSPQTWTDNNPASPTNGQTFSTSYSWQFFGVPVEIVGTTAANGFSKHTTTAPNNSYWISEYSESRNATDRFYDKWIPQGAGDALIAFSGYEITQNAPDKYSITGKLVFGDQSVAVTRKAAEVTGSSSTDPNVRRYGLGQNIIGNSYTSAIDVQAITFDSDLEQTVYIYNTGSIADWKIQAGNTTALPDSTIEAPGLYMAIVKNAATPLWNSEIPSMQGFMVKFASDTYDAANETSQLTLAYASNHANTKVQKAPADRGAYLRVVVSSGYSADAVLLIEKAGTTAGFDNGWDGFKQGMPLRAAIFAESPDGDMQISANETMVGTYISVKADSITPHTLTLKADNLQNYSDLTLVDLVTGANTPLQADVTTYTYTPTVKNLIERRFLIAATPTGTEVVENAQLLSAYVAGDNTLVVSNYAGEAGTIALLDIAGKVVFSNVINDGFTEFSLNTLPQGVYLATLRASNSLETVKVVIR